MKLIINCELSSKNPERIKDLMVIANYIKSGKFQAEMREGVRCKATVKVEEEQ